MKSHWLFQVILMLTVAFPTASAECQSLSFPGQQWEVVPVASQGLNESKLGDAVAYLESVAGDDGARELVIVRNGAMVWRGPQADKIHGVWSCTKSFTSTTLGLLVEDGKCDLDDKASRWLPALESSYSDVTLRHFATMTSGYRAIGDEPQGSYRHGPSRTPFDPNPQPLFSPPGTTYAYWDSAMNQFSNVLTRIAEEPLEDLFRRRIADPIQMDPDHWRWGDFGEVDGVVVNGGAGNQGGHIYISATEMARFGLLMLSRGNWNGKQLISRECVEWATSLQVPADSIDVHPDSGADGRGAYGLNWWVNGVKPDGERKWPGIPDGTFAASGFHNNDLFVIPAWRMVVVRLGLD